SRGRHDTSSQFQRKNPGFQPVRRFTENGRNLWEIALRSGEVRGSVGWAVADTATFQPAGESSMHLDLAAEIAALPRLHVSELRARFAVVFGEPTPSHNKVWLVKRIAWRLQAQAEGDLSQRARQRAAELAADADLRVSAPPSDAMTATPDRPPALRVPADDRRPRPGTILSRRYKGRTLQVED